MNCLFDSREAAVRRAPIVFTILACLSWGMPLVLFAQDQEPHPLAAGRMIQQLHQNDWILRADALDYLAKHRVSDALKPIQNILNENTSSPWMRSRALVAAARIDGSRVRDQVFSFAKHENPQLRKAAAEALAEYQGEDVVRALEILLKDNATEVRYLALASYAKHRGPAAWPVVEKMTESLDVSVCQWGARALALVGHDPALDRLTELASRREFRKSLAPGIQDLKNPNLIGLWVRILTDIDPRSKQFSIGLNALQQFEDAAVLNTLKTNLASNEPAILRCVASIVTVSLQDPELGEALRKAVSTVEDVGTIRSVLIALGSRPMKPDRHHEFFAKYLDHKDANIRALAIRGLAHCRSVNLYQLLGRRMNDKSPQVIEAALGALQRASPTDAPQGQLVDFLKSVLASEHQGIRTKAYELLGYAGSPNDFKPAMALLEVRLRSTDNESRTQAAAAIGEFAPYDQICAIAQTQGYVSHWKILGTFLNDKEHTGFARAYPPDQKIDFEATYKAKYVWAVGGNDGKREGELEREISWRDATVDQTDGQLNIPPIVPPPAAMAVAYAVADFTVAADRNVLLTVDGDDAFRVYLNGKEVAKQIAEYVGNAPCVAIQPNIKVALKAGKNRFIVKTATVNRDWWVRLRLTDNAGLPVKVGP